MQLKHNKTRRRSNHKRELLTTVEYRHFQLLRIINLITLFLFGVILGIAAMFLYNRIYTVIGQAQYILSIEKTPISNSIDFQLLDKVNKQWDEKYSIEPLVIKRDPFNVVPEPPPVPEAIPEEITPTTTTSTP